MSALTSRAAELLRERAKAAGPFLWGTRSWMPGVVTDGFGEALAGCEDEDVAAYISTVDPLLGLSLAAWLAAEPETASERAIEVAARILGDEESREQSTDPQEPQPPASQSLRRRCNCEHGIHEHADGAACPGHAFSLEARADGVGEVCDECALQCVSEYLTTVGGMAVSEVTQFVLCHQGGDGTPVCLAHAPQRVEVLHATVVTDAGEVLADFYGPDRMRNACTLALSLAQAISQRPQ